MADSANPRDDARRPAVKRSAADIWLAALTYWYLTGLIAALGFSLGFSLLRPGSGTVVDKRDWLDAFDWMDGRWYKQIAMTGYEYDPNKNTNIAFFPVYPLLGRVVMRITGLRAEAALLVVSNLSLLAALAMLAFYVRDRYPDAPAELTDYTVLAASLFPTGCFFRLTYSESTFLLLAILAMYAMLRRWPLWAIALLVGLATAARPVGVALLAPFAIHIWHRGHRVYEPAAPARPNKQHPDETDNALDDPETPVNVQTRRPRSSLGFVLVRLAFYLPLACWGAIAFTAYQYCAFNEPFATVRVQKNWGIGAVPWCEKIVPLATLEPVRAVYDVRSHAFWTNRDSHRIPWFSLQFANPIFFVLAVMLIGLGASLRVRGGWHKGLGAAARSHTARWLSLQEFSLAAVMLLIPYVTRAYEMAMGSMGRFVAVDFPIYFVLAHVLERLPGALRSVVLALCGVFLSLYAALYSARYLIF